MNANCIICSDPFTPKSDIFTTSCGHLFHHACLLNWIERAKTCPQCRHKETESSIHRIYLNIASAENIADDVITLRAKLDTVNFEVSLKDAEIAKYSTRYKACKASCDKIRASIVEMEQKHRAHDTNILALKYQLGSYKEKMQDKEKFVAENKRLKTQLENMEHLRNVATKAQGQVEDMIKTNKDPASLGILVTTMKKQLVETKKRNQHVTSQLTTLGKDMINTNAHIERNKKRNEQLRSDLEAHESCAEEISYIEGKISHVKAENSSSNSNDCYLDASSYTPETSRSSIATTSTSDASLTPAHSQHSFENVKQRLRPLSNLSQGQETEDKHVNVMKRKSGGSHISASKFRKLAPTTRRNE